MLCLEGEPVRVFTLSNLFNRGKDRPRLRSPLIAVAAGVALVMQIFDPAVAWRMLLLCLVSLLLIGYGWTQSLMQGVTIKRSRRYGWAQVGDRVEENFELSNASRWPLLWVEIEDTSTLPGYSARRVESTGGNASKRWIIDMICSRRGVYQLGPMSLRLGDPLGLFEATRDYPTVETFVVYPPVSRLPHIELPRGAAAGASRVRRRALEWTTNAAGVRHYVPGDELRAVHWPLSAKHDTLYVKEFDLEPSGNVWIILDLDAVVHVGQGAESTEEYAVIFAASLLNAMLSEGRAVGLAFSGSAPTIIPPSRGSDHFWRVLRALALAGVNPGLTLADFLAGSASSLGRGMTLVLVTPAVQGAWLGRLLALQRQGLAAHVVLIDPTSFQTPPDRAGDSVVALATRLAEAGVSMTRVEKGYRFDPIIRGKRQGRQEYVIGATGRLILRPDAEG